MIEKALVCTRALRTYTRIKTHTYAFILKKKKKTKNNYFSHVIRLEFRFGYECIEMFFLTSDH